MPDMGTLKIAVVSAVLLASMGGASRASASPTASAARACGHRPGSTLVLTEADNGRRLCAHRGQRVQVVLRVDADVYPSPDQWWSPIVVSGHGLVPDPSGPQVMPARGVTLAQLRATAHGRAVLTSNRHPCAASGGAPTCHVLVGWSATVVVR